MDTNSPTRTWAAVKYIVKGCNPTREHQADLQTELADNLPNAISIVILPVVEGFSVEIEVSDTAPFSGVSFEPYIAEHVLLEAVRLRCQPNGELALQLIKSQFH